VTLAKGRPAQCAATARSAGALVDRTALRDHPVQAVQYSTARMKQCDAAMEGSVSVRNCHHVLHCN
jgi:hypothetical protein